MDGPVLDLRQSHFVADRGDIAAIGTWYRFRYVGWRPVLVLANAYDLRHAERAKLKPRLYVVPMDRVVAWCEESGMRDDAAAIAGAKRAAEDMGLDAGMHTTFRILSIVRDLLGEVLAMPPRPAMEQRAIGDFVVTIDGRKEVHKEITEDV
jgi:hypothetical protein